MRRIGIFGGSFDPVHAGHLRPAAAALAAFGFDAVIFVPAGDPPHKPGQRLCPFVHRFAMLALATRDEERFLVSDIEQHRPGPTYTVDTLRLLRDRHPADRLHFLMGSDSFAQIATWHRWEELIELADLVVLHREGPWGEALAARAPRALAELIEQAPRSGRPAAPGSGGRRVFLLDHEPVRVSATELRERLRRGEPAGDLIPPEVVRYIVKYHLYEDSGEPTDGC